MIDYEKMVKEVFPDAEIKYLTYNQFDLEYGHFIYQYTNGCYCHISTQWMPKAKKYHEAWQSAYEHLVKHGKIIDNK